MKSSLVRIGCIDSHQLNTILGQFVWRWIVLAAMFQNYMTEFV
jgi:hypothetical protein